jgi:hypothetical protein
MTAVHNEPLVTDGDCLVLTLLQPCCAAPFPVGDERRSCYPVGAWAAAQRQGVMLSWPACPSTFTVRVRLDLLFGRRTAQSCSISRCFLEISFAHIEVVEICRPSLDCS